MQIDVLRKLRRGTDRADELLPSLLERLFHINYKPAPPVYRRNFRPHLNPKPVEPRRTIRRPMPEHRPTVHYTPGPGGMNGKPGPGGHGGHNGPGRRSR